MLITGDEVNGIHADKDFQRIVTKVFDDVLPKPLTKQDFESFIKRHATILLNNNIKNRQ